MSDAPLPNGHYIIQSAAGNGLGVGERGPVLDVNLQPIKLFPTNVTKEVSLLHQVVEI